MILLSLHPTRNKRHIAFPLNPRHAERSSFSTGQRYPSRCTSTFLQSLRYWCPASNPCWVFAVVNSDYPRLSSHYCYALVSGEG